MNLHVLSADPMRGVTGKHPRDRKSADIIKCKKCGHIQMFPLLSKEEYDEEYAKDKSVLQMVDCQLPRKLTLALSFGT